MTEEPTNQPKKSGGGADPNAWMSTFSDLLLLMLTFFVLLLSMSSLDQKDVRSLTRDGIKLEQSESDQMVVVPEAVMRKADIAEAMEKLQMELSQPMDRPRLEKVEQLLEEVLATTGMQGPMWVEQRPRGVLVNVDGSVVFEEGSAELTPKARAFLGQFAASLAGGEQQVVTEAFVKPTAEANSWDETWDLALRRADRTVNFLIGQGIKPERLSIAGYGFEAGKAEKRFMRNAELIRFHIVVGPLGAEPGGRPEQAPSTTPGE